MKSHFSGPRLQRWYLPCDMLSQNSGAMSTESGVEGFSMQLKWALLLSLPVAFVLFAQGELGTFNGTITDPSGAAIAGAAVKVVNPETGVEFNTKTNDAGIYRLPSLPAGTYRITVSSAGFKSAVRENVVLSVAQ